MYAFSYKRVYVYFDELYIDRYKFIYNIKWGVKMKETTRGSKSDIVQVTPPKQERTKITQQLASQSERGMQHHITIS